MQLQIEIDDRLTPQALVELINMGMAKAEYTEGKLVIKPVELDKEEKIVEHVRLVPPDRFTNVVINNSEFDDELKKRVFEQSIREFGIIYPVIAVKNIEGKYTVVDGAERVKIAKKLQMPVPTIVKPYDETLCLLANFISNFARKNLSISDMAKLFKEITKKGGNILLREVCGLKTTEIFAVMESEKYKDVIEKLKYRPISVTVEVAKIAMRDEDKAREVAQLVVREEATTSEEVKELKEKVNDIKAGIYCALCGDKLNKETVNWIAVCSCCKYSLYEELKQVILDKKVKCFIDGHRYYGDEMVTVHKENLKKLLLDIPEDVRISKGWQGVLERLGGGELKVVANA